MNKKVKWSIIFVSTATALTFGGLVVNNPNTSSSASGLEQTSTIEDSNSAFNENGNQSEDRFVEGGHHEWSSENGSEQEVYDSDSSIEDTYDQGSSWNEEQFQQAPSDGFEQGQGSSGASR